MDTDKKPLISYDTKIGVLYGGMSSERDVSLRSGKNCYEALLRLGYKNVELIDVDKNIASKLIEKNIELAYIALHGKYGEDGCIQGLLEILGIPYTGCGVEASAVCMNKETTKKVLKDSDIPLIKSVTIKKEDDIFEKIKCLSYPFMVKPLWEGSSIGMSKASDSEELKKSVNEAFKYSPEVMIEEYLIGKSTTVGVLDLQDKTIATSILEFRTKTEWYDFEAKYTKGLTEFVLPAELDKEMTEKIKSLAIKAHKTVGATGMSRVDFLVTKDTPYVLEINTIPGMTDLSDLPAQSKDIGISYDELVNIILQSATMPKK